ncbi:MAG: hypothetical protein MAG431_00707 [Chloroflexi bacterium]|nr:hypothetical protein [Chloroflexota bacterium]
MLVKDRMTTDPICGKPDMSVTKAREVMIEKGFRHLPILNEERELIGLITRGTLSKALPADVSSFSHFEISYVLAKIKAHTIMVSLLGARQSGIRISVLQPDRVGAVAELTNAIAKAGGYLSVKDK